MLDSQGPRAAVADSLIGRTLNGRFSIIEPLGVGGMGKVYRALQAPLDRVVALKVLSPNFPSSRDPGFQQRFLREASLSSKLRHPNTVTLIDYGQTEDGIYYIAMEYLEGRTLAQELSRVGPLPWGRALDVAQQVCRSLREAHNLGIVHRDLKPANIMLLNEADQDVVKVLDFGLVKSILPPQNGSRSPEITQHGTFLGSPQYIAPEQARNVADARSDVYSLGIVLYQMVMGRTPFISKDYVELIFSHFKEPPPLFSSIRPDLAVPVAIENVVRKCLEKDPARRPQSMDELLEGMREANHAAGGQSGMFMRPGFPSGPFPAPPGGSNGPTDWANSETVAVNVGAYPPGSRRRRSPGRALVIGAGVVLGLLPIAGGTARVLAQRRIARRAMLRQSEAAHFAAAPQAVPEQLAIQVGPSQSASRVLRTPVHFLLTSEPSGAHVYYKGKDQGTTPFVLEVRPDGEDVGVTVELTFAKAGYQSERVVTGGSGEVVLRQKLQKKPPPPPKLPPPPPPAVAVAHPEPTSAVATPAKTETVVPFAQGMTRPERLKGRDIEYTSEALAAGVQGLMRVKCVITSDGRVENCKILETLPFMEQAVLDALKSRTYAPATQQGKPVAVEYVFNIRLRPPPP